MPLETETRNVETETTAFETETETETETRSLETETIKNWSLDVLRPRPVSRRLEIETGLDTLTSLEKATCCYDDIKHRQKPKQTA